MNLERFVIPKLRIIKMEIFHEVGAGPTSWKKLGLLQNAAVEVDRNTSLADVSEMQL